MFCQLLHRINPDLNMARFYRIEVMPDLFGQMTVERRWGRIGGRGQYRVASYPSIHTAESAASDLVRAKERRGYRVASGQ
jgi:predicted DNA-binding WGR domain protein